jgi:Tol biopolymer transport system component
MIEDTQSAARRVLLNTADQIVGVAASPDGTRIVYAGGPVDRDLVEYSGDGKFFRTIAASSILEGFPAWAPAGDRFVYRAGGPGQSDSLWLGSPNSPQTTLLQRLTAAASQSPVSPDGGRVAFADGEGLEVISVSGGRPIRVLTAADLDRGLCWSPDGEWIWFSRGPLRLGRVSSGGGQPEFITSKPGLLVDCSPDLRWILRYGPGGYVLTSADGKSERFLVSSTTYARADNSAEFSKDGKRLYFLGLDRRTIDVLDVESGQKLRTISFTIPLEDQIEGFAFNPDGSRVLLTTGGDRNDLWMAEGFAEPAVWWKRWLTHWEARPPSP